MVTLEGHDGALRAWTGDSVDRARIIPQIRQTHLYAGYSNIWRVANWIQMRNMELPFVPCELQLAVFRIHRNALLEHTLTVSLALVSGALDHQLIRSVLQPFAVQALQRYFQDAFGLPNGKDVLIPCSARHL